MILASGVAAEMLRDKMLRQFRCLRHHATLDEPLLGMLMIVACYKVRRVVPWPSLGNETPISAQVNNPTQDVRLAVQYSAGAEGVHSA